MFNSFRINGSSISSRFRNTSINIRIREYNTNSLLLEGVNKAVQTEVKEQKGGFLSMLSGTLGASLLENLLTGKGIYRAGKGKGINRAGEGIVRAGFGNNKMDF